VAASGGGASVQHVFVGWRRRNGDKTGGNGGVGVCRHHQCRQLHPAQPRREKRAMSACDDIGVVARLRRRRHHRRRRKEDSSTEVGRQWEVRGAGGATFGFTSLHLTPPYVLPPPSCPLPITACTCLPCPLPACLLLLYTLLTPMLLVPHLLFSWNSSACHAVPHVPHCACLPSSVVLLLLIAGFGGVVAATLFCAGVLFWATLVGCPGWSLYLACALLLPSCLPCWTALLP